MTLRAALQRLILSWLEKRVPDWNPEKTESPAIVFSPHYDDETLGAGGTIIKLRQSGVPVYLVFMTDGSKSHAEAMAGTTLSQMRRKEALKAASILGIEAHHCRFLQYPETRLSEYYADAVQKVGELLTQLPCQRVFIPSTLEPLIWSADHRATSAIVLEALRRTRSTPDVVEYLVWFWYHWPWVPLQRGADARQILRLTVQNAFGVRTCLSVNSAIDISDVVTTKLEALNEYRTQMTRLVTTKPWPVLSDVGCGDFLNNFFRRRELFRTYTYLAGRP